MDNPLEQEAPTDPIAQIHELARDLAYGAINNLWKVRIQIVTSDDTLSWTSPTSIEEIQAGEVGEIPLIKYLEVKWSFKQPSEYMLLQYGYFELYQELPYSNNVYLLTSKAFDLLDKPAKPPSVFISYKRSESSAFALLIEARLKMAGNPNPFVDKNLVPGEEWHNELEEHIKGCRYFICLIGKTTLESTYVRKEIEWATQIGCTIISIWHGSAEIDLNTPEALKNRHIITVKGESALDYEVAIIQLLSSVGYATY